MAAQRMADKGAFPSRPESDIYGDSFPRMRVTSDGIAVVPIAGALMKAASGFEKWFHSLGSHEDIGMDLDAARATCRGILLHVNSPGGTVTGTPELADKVSAIAKSGFPIACFTEDSMCSAAEYITAGCNARFATSSATVGSIGVIMQILDLSKLHAAIGVQYNVFASGKFKAMGHGSGDLTPDQKSFLQSWVDGRGAEFRKHMTANRPKLPASAMEGQMFNGAEAKNIGLIDKVVSGMDEALAFFKGSKGKATATAPRPEVRREAEKLLAEAHSRGLVDRDIGLSDDAAELAEELDGLKQILAAPATPPALPTPAKVTTPNMSTTATDKLAHYRSLTGEDKYAYWKKNQAELIELGILEANRAKAAKEAEAVATTPLPAILTQWRGLTGSASTKFYREHKAEILEAAREHETAINRKKQ